MSNSKVVMSQAANTLTTPLNVEDVFSTYLYEGNDTTQTINNGIDLDGEGGLVWIKSRVDQVSHTLYDTERGALNALFSNATADESTISNSLTSFNSTGFSVGSSYIVNDLPKDFTSWTFRKAPKFFDVVTYTGTGSPQTISHNLGSKPGAIFVKTYDNAQGWAVQHRSLTATDRLILEENYAANADSNYWNDTEPTDTTFTVGSTIRTNSNGYNYVAYLFAHNDGDGEFGGEADADIIKCGSYTGNGSADGPEVDLGFEPQWVMIKQSSSGGTDWYMHDNMRGIATGGNDARLKANLSEAEYNLANYIDLKSTGFKLGSGNAVNNNGQTHIYIAIRRGTKVPESGTEVFALQQDDAGDGNAPAFRSDFPVDAAFSKNAAGVSVNFFGSRLQGANYLRTSETNAEAANADFQWDYMNGWNSEPAQGPSVISYMWKRAPNFFDVVAYTGNGTAGRTVSHNLGVAPEMIWVKRRDSANSWNVYAGDATKVMYLNGTIANTTYGVWDDTEPTSTNFTLSSFQEVNASSSTYIAYLFASLDGVSKVGSYTGNGSSQTIDCGFTSGSRFILVKRTDSTGDWYVWDTERGIVAGNDPYLELNTTDAEVTSTDWVDPDNSGFIVNGTTINASGGEYIFYAVA